MDGTQAAHRVGRHYYRRAATKEEIDDAVTPDVRPRRRIDRRQDVV